MTLAPVGDIRANKNEKLYQFAKTMNVGQEWNLAGSATLTLNNLPVGDGTTGYQPYKPFTVKSMLQSNDNGLVYRYAGEKYYELKDHLGNVRVVISDRKDLNTADNTLSAHVESYNNYYPFGMLQPNRTFNNPRYRYGFQGQEKDDDLKGDGNSVNYKYRMHDPRVGRFFAVDPLFKDYPYYTPFSFSGNKLIGYIELEGLEEARINQAIDWNTAIKMAGDKATINEIQEKYEYIHGFTSRAANTRLFKSFFKSDLAQSFIEKYGSFERGTYEMTHEETIDTHPSPVSIIHGNHEDYMRGEASNFLSELKYIEKGASKFVELSVLSKANTKGTLGVFTVKFRGDLKREAEGNGWSFNGTMQFFDEWNFDQKSEGERTASSENATAKGRKFLLGRPFEIKSPLYKVYQNNENSVIDWFENIDSSSDELSKLGKTVSKY
ncbi:hypothetical protein HX109_13610 [Galbibacter sp. BG1]|uniref:RHS repeat domain-containing protein n=1 Tax=Galbibacter sp. BG1 TaxID=1170699 RepID=UPI0015BE119C|nr:hypothetical protein [Galbibacter sp. BG1]QLE02545.1 hypothetical protein HX109_13610 [Galbibacter sp. BG1]